MKKMNEAAVARKGKGFDTRQAWAFAFCLPNILFFLIFFVAPAIVGVWYSLTNYNGFKQMDFVGLDNYIRLFQDSDFYSTLQRGFRSHRIYRIPWIRYAAVIRED